MNRTNTVPRVLVLLALTLLVVPGIAGCAGSGPTEATWTYGPGGTPVAAAPGASHGSMAMSEAMAAAWTARPAYVGTTPGTEEAYAFAMAHPEIVQWMPCYCGCEAMAHRSNLDCFFKPTNDGRERLTFEEHASYCQVCVDEALMAKQLSAQGQSLRAIRDAIDKAFEGGAPGTQTALPPA
jgi:hypothetical protein